MPRIRALRSVRTPANPQRLSNRSILGRRSPQSSQAGRSGGPRRGPTSWEGQPGDRLVGKGGARLAGRITASGSKNAVLPIMAAALLTDEPLVLRRVPELRDVATMIKILERLGVTAEAEGRDLILRGSTHGPAEADYDLVSTMSASVGVLGPLV